MRFGDWVMFEGRDVRKELVCFALLLKEKHIQEELYIYSIHAQ